MGMSSLFFEGSDFEELLAFINEQNTDLIIPLTTKNVKLGKVEYLDVKDSEGNNTVVELIGIDGEGYTGSIIVKYYRQFINSVYGNVCLYHGFQPAKKGDIVQLGDCFPGTNLKLIEKTGVLSGLMKYVGEANNLIFFSTVGGTALQAHY